MHDALVAKIWRRLSIRFDSVIMLGGRQNAGYTERLRLSISITYCIYIWVLTLYTILEMHR